MEKKEDTVNSTKKPWPTQAAMQQIYEMKLWGGESSDFYSGDGSHDHDIVDPYIAAVTSFLTSFENPLIVCDLGCGDFNIGKQLVPFTKKYIGIDIVPTLIERNRNTYHAKNLEFRCSDIAKDSLPMGDCVLVRQVLQHLSNAEVQSILEKLRAYNYVILTEHIPTGIFVPNKDIISGQGTRLKKQSGLDVLAPPFQLKIKTEKQVLSVQPKNHNGVIVTTLFELF
ncbi:class I SAM-dependent methyltransferase [Aquimarina sp. 2-A2]|uniref:class I SAM-dependent methyltransferase n=1 Tax=Aquimarina sp. 2-A2 TaxID=3382644 RepID=UPI00387F0467